MKKSHKILITGPNGFVGSRLIRLFGPDATAGTRDMLGDLASYHKINAEILCDFSTIIHTAARVHKKGSDDLFFTENTTATLVLARKAVEAGVKRFIFLSTIGVNGITSIKPFTPFDILKPYNAFTKSKFEAEQGLLKIQKETGLEVVIIRPPLIYGDGAPGNYEALVKLIRTGLPLPFGRITNQRSFVSIEQLCSTLRESVYSEKTPAQIILPRDAEDRSTSEFVREIASAINVKVRLYWFPKSVFWFLAAVTYKMATYHGLFSTMQIKKQNYD